MKRSVGKEPWVMSGIREKPGRGMSTMRMEIPRCRGASARAASSAKICGKPVQGVGHVHPEPAVPVMTYPNGPGCLLSAPVPGHVEVGGLVAALRQPPARRQGGQVHRPGHDVDVGDLLGNRLERGQRPAECFRVATWSLVRASAPATAPSASAHAPATASWYRSRRHPARRAPTRRAPGRAGACIRAARSN